MNQSNQYWRFDYSRDLWISGDKEISELELKRMDIWDVLERCPGLLLRWWKII